MRITEHGIVLPDAVEPDPPRLGDPGADALFAPRPGPLEIRRPEMRKLADAALAALWIAMGLRNPRAARMADEPDNETSRWFYWHVAKTLLGDEASEREELC